MIYVKQKNAFFVSLTIFLKYFFKEIKWRERKRWADYFLPLLIFNLITLISILGDCIIFLSAILSNLFNYPLKYF